MHFTTAAVGSLDALAGALIKGYLGDLTGRDVVVVPTAAAFTGATRAAVVTGACFEPSGCRIEALMVTDRASAQDPYFVGRINEADLVVLTDGNALHLRTTLRGTVFGNAIATRPLLTVGASSTAIFDEMIDPRGGAPTSGLDWRRGVVIDVPSSDEELLRTRTLLAAERELIVLHERDVLLQVDDDWALTSLD